ncbi:MAG: cytochrome b N-terminal domain-containing protein [Chloroflexi bacterium]|nr:cytochrome b N-terminal domain-containing protein [Chloroflexota bacterium]
MISSLYEWADERLGIKPLIDDFANHAVPERVNPLRHPHAFVYCFGGISFFLILLLVGSGLFLALFYVGSPEQAQSSIRYIESSVPLGGLIRGVHRWSATLLVLMILLHMSRVYVHGAYRRPRELNWVTGVLLLAMVLTIAATGYTLRWDVQSYTLVLVMRNTFESSPVVGPLLSGLFLGSSWNGEVPLSRGFAMHVWLLPLILAVLLIVHFLMVRKQGISRPL